MKILENFGPYDRGRKIDLNNQKFISLIFLVSKNVIIKYIGNQNKILKQTSNQTGKSVPQEWKETKYRYENVYQFVADEFKKININVVLSNITSINLHNYPHFTNMRAPYHFDVGAYGDYGVWFLEKSFFPNDHIGITGLGSMCSNHPNAFVADSGLPPKILARKVIHELLHSLGVEHIENCKHCFMNRYLNENLCAKIRIHPKSRKMLRKSLPDFTCLQNIPNKTYFNQNGIRDEGSNCVEGTCCLDCKIVEKGTFCHTSDMGSSYCDGVTHLCPDETYEGAHGMNVTIIGCLILSFCGFLLHFIYMKFKNRTLANNQENRLGEDIVDNNDGGEGIDENGWQNTDEKFDEKLTDIHSQVERVPQPHGFENSCSQNENMNRTPDGHPTQTSSPYCHGNFPEQNDNDDNRIIPVDNYDDYGLPLLVDNTNPYRETSL
jgi:hypothetical protein